MLEETLDCMVVYFIRDKDEKINKYTVLSVLSPTTAIPIGLKCHKATLYNRLMMMSDMSKLEEESNFLHLYTSLDLSYFK